MNQKSIMRFSRNTFDRLLKKLTNKSMKMKLSEEEILKKIHETINEIDADGLAAIAADLFGGDCEHDGESFLFEPNENYQNAFGVVRWHPDVNGTYFIPSLADDDFYSPHFWYDDRFDHKHLNKGLVFKTKAAAAEAGRAALKAIQDLQK